MKTSPDIQNDPFYELAVKALARRARSTDDIRLLLEKKKAGKKQIEAVLKRLRENGYLDDARFARYFASAKLDNDLHGKERVRRDLKGRGLKDEIAHEAVSKAYQDVDESELLRRYLKRKVVLSRPLSKPSAVASLYRRLLHAGFASDTIIQELKRILQSPLLKGRSAASATEPVAWDELLDSLADTSDTEVELD